MQGSSGSARGCSSRADPPARPRPAQFFCRCAHSARAGMLRGGGRRRRVPQPPRGRRGRRGTRAQGPSLFSPRPRGARAQPSVAAASSSCLASPPVRPPNPRHVTFCVHRVSGRACQAQQSGARARHCPRCAHPILAVAAALFSPMHCCLLSRTRVPRRTPPGGGRGESLRSQRPTRRAAVVISPHWHADDA